MEAISNSLHELPHENVAKIGKADLINPSAYVYLAESIRAWPTQEQLAADMSAAGWRNPSWVNLTGGVVAVHTAIKGS